MGHTDGVQTLVGKQNVGPCGDRNKWHRNKEASCAGDVCQAEGPEGGADEVSVESFGLLPRI